MKRLKNLRIEKNKTQEEVAEFLEISRPAYSRYESSEREPDFSTLKKLAQYFGVTVDYLLENETPAEVPPNFPARLKYLREQKGVSYEQMANDTGYTPEDIEAFENGTKEPEFKTLSQFTDYFDTTMDFLTANEPEDLSQVAMHGGGRVILDNQKPLSPKAKEVIMKIIEMGLDDPKADLLLAMLNAMGETGNR